MGNRCDFFSPERSPTPKYQIPCPFLQRRGFCLKGNTCDLSHVKSHTLENTLKQPPQNPFFDLSPSPRNTTHKPDLSLSPKELPPADMGGDSIFTSVRASGETSDGDCSAAPISLFSSFLTFKVSWLRDRNFNFPIPVRITFPRQTMR